MPSGVRVDESERQAITADMNLRNLKRLDSAITKVLCSSSQVAVYSMAVAGNDGSKREWVRRDIEGSLYVVARNSSGQDGAYRVVVLNRKSPENFVDDVVPGMMDLESANQMIMFQSPDGRVTGLWFYVKSEMKSVFDFMRAIVDETELPAAPILASLSSSIPRSKPAKNSATSKPKRKAKGPRQSKPAPPASGKGSVESKPSEESTPPAVPPVKTESQKASPPAGSAVGAEAVVPESSSAPGEAVRSSDMSFPAKADSVDDSLVRFFPNIKLTNGVAGPAPPSNATRAEADGSPPRSEQAPTAGLGETANSRSTVDNQASANAAAENAPPSVENKHSAGGTTSTSATAYHGLAQGHGVMPHPHFPLRVPPPPGMLPNGIHHVQPSHHQSHMMMMMQSLQSLQSRDQQLNSQLQQLALQPSHPHSSAQSQQLQHELVHVRQNSAQLQSRIMQHHQAIAQSAGAVGSQPPHAAPVNFPGMHLTHVPPVGGPTSSPHPSGSGPPANPPTQIVSGAKKDVTVTDNAMFAGLAAVQAASEVGNPGGPAPLDRGQFRAILMRMLSDNKLFESAYQKLQGGAPQ